MSGIMTKENHMKQFKIFFGLAGLTFGMAVGLALAHAQQAPAAPTVQSTAEDANRAIAVLQEQRNRALDEAAAARVAMVKIQAELAAEKKMVEELKVKIPAPPVLDGPTAPAK